MHIRSLLKTIFLSHKLHSTPNGGITANTALDLVMRVFVSTKWSDAQTQIKTVGLIQYFYRLTSEAQSTREMKLLSL